MRLSMDLELQDIPGQLLLAMQPLRDNKANIISVVHHRDRKTPRGMIPVRFVVEMDRSRIETVQARLKESGISVVRAGEDRFIEAVSVVLVGHVLDSDLGDTINRIDTTGFAEVMDLSLTMPGVNEPILCLPQDSRHRQGRDPEGPDHLAKRWKREEAARD